MELKQDILFQELSHFFDLIFGFMLVLDTT